MTELIRHPKREDLEYLLPIIRDSGYDYPDLFQTEKFGKFKSLSECVRERIENQQPDKKLYILRDNGTIGLALFDVIGDHKDCIYLNFLLGEGVGKRLIEILKEEWTFVYADVLNRDGRTEKRKAWAKRYGAKVGDIYYDTNMCQRNRRCDVVFSRTFETSANMD